MKLFKKIYNRLIARKSLQELDLEELIENGMTVGQNCYFYSSTGFDHIYPHLISFGDDVTVSTNVTILAHDASTNIVSCGTKLGRVCVGSNVFIGSGTIILCNTKIGSNVIIGAGSVVSRDLPDNGVYAGVPARRICSIEEYRKKMLDLRSTCPDVSTIRPWYEWPNVSSEDKKQMQEALENGPGFI